MVKGLGGRATGATDFRHLRFRSLGFKVYRA